MRDLYNQVILSSRRLAESIKSKDKIYLKKTFTSLLNKNDRSPSLKYDEFLKLFEKKINYIMAFSNTNSDSLIEDNVKNVKSSIAKFSIIQSSSEMRSNYYELFFAQISH